MISLYLDKFLSFVMGNIYLLRLKIYNISGQNL